MTKVRLGVIGLGNIGRHHASCLRAGKIIGAELVSVANPSRAKLQEFSGLKTFDSGEGLIASGTVDAVVIATPHYQHTSLGLLALQHGLHVMVEKPISAHKADAERLIAAHRQRPSLVFAAMFQLRTEPRYQKIRALIQSGELGEVVRVNWIMTDWYRTQAYYASSAWRATWKGEGGGVLLNQCPHNLDMWQWLLGMPARLRGFCRLGRYHAIEVEDDVTAYLDYPSGTTGVFVASTGEAPGTNRLEITGTRGRLVLEGGRLRWTRTAMDTREFSDSAQAGFAQPEVTETEVPFESVAEPHAVLMQNFVDAILQGEPLIAPGEEGLASVELANAILYSSLTGQTLELPLDGEAYEKRLHELIAGSTLKKKVVEVSASDFTSSFRK